MTPEEKQLLLKDLCGRLPYGVKFQGEDSNVYTLDAANYFALQVEDVVFKPYLRPMSSMTDEEKKMVCSMNGLSDTEINDRIEYPNMYVQNYIIETFDLFNVHHIDYRGLIKKGLALEAPEGMYKTE